MSRVLKFRQWVSRLNMFHYFGFTDGNCSGVVEASIKDNPIFQFTGLTDKNGKDIYEGDIVKVEHNLEQYNGEVIFENGSYILKRLVTTKYADYGDLVNTKNIAEVIGNVFENPELLENKEGK